MRKWITFLILFVLLIVGATYFAYSQAAYLLQTIISSRTNLSTTIEAVHFNPSQVMINNLQIANPKEAIAPTALKVASLSITAPYNHYLKDPIVIKEIHLDQIDLNIELYNRSQTRGNWQTLMKQMEQKEKKKSFFSIERKTEIKKLLLTTIRIELILANGERRRLSPIRELAFYDISSEEGIPMQEISQAIIKHMLHSIFLEKGLKSLFQAPENLLRGVLSPFFSHQPLSRRPPYTSYHCLPRPQGPPTLKKK